MNLNKFTKAELIHFLERNQEADRKANESRWALVAELNKLKEAENERRADTRELVEQQIEPLTIAISDFESRLDFESAFGDLSAESLTLVKDLFRHVSTAADDVLSTTLRN